MLSIRLRTDHVNVVSAKFLHSEVFLFPYPVRSKVLSPACTRSRGLRSASGREVCQRMCECLLKPPLSLINIWERDVETLQISCFFVRFYPLILAFISDLACSDVLLQWRKGILKQNKNRNIKKKKKETGKGEEKMYTLKPTSFLGGRLRSG